jgi:hypothetical protein
LSQDSNETGSPAQSDVYWAAETGTDEYVSNVKAKVQAYYNFYTNTGLFALDKTSYMATYGLSPDGEAISFRPTFSGRNGQLTKIAANHYVNIRNHISSLITSRKPVLDAKASNGDADSSDDAKLDNAALEHFIRQLGMEAASRELVKSSLDTREGWMWLRWDGKGGDVYAADESGQPIRTGTPAISTHMGQDVIRDVASLGNKEPSWLILRDFANRFDLVAEFPEFEDEIKAEASYSRSEWFRIELQPYSVASDLVPVYRVFHKPTPALPNGRWSTICGDALLLDGKASYGGRMPLLELSPDCIRGTPFGHTPMYDLLGLQTILNALISGAITNEIAFAVKRLLIPRNQPITAKQLSEDLGVIQYDNGLRPPEELKITLNTGERLEAIQFITQLFETLSAVNSVIRGNTEGVKTDAASGLALLQTQALQYFTDLAFQYADFWRRWGELLLAILRERADMPLMIAVAGKSKKSTLARLTKHELADEYHVQVDLGDPTMRTPAQRTAQAQFMATNGMLGASPAEIASNYMSVQATGSMDEILDEFTAEKDNISRENEAMMRGEIPGVSEFDTPALHAKLHAVVSQSAEARTELLGEANWKSSVAMFAQQMGPQIRPGMDPASHPLAPKRPKSPIMDALRQHMLEHREQEQEMASIQDAQAAALVTIQAQNAPQLATAPGGPPAPQGGPPRASGGAQPSGHQKNPNANPAQDLSQSGKLPPTPPQAQPVPGVQ